MATKLLRDENYDDDDDDDNDNDDDDDDDNDDEEDEDDYEEGTTEISHSLKCEDGFTKNEHSECIGK